jgi:16S rRNA processing protein RimM
MTPASASPEQGEVAGPSGDRPVFLVVGKLLRPHGVHGEMLMGVLTDFPERLVPGTTLFVGPQYQPLRLRTLRRHQRGLLVAFEGYQTPEAVAVLRNQYASVRTEDRPPLEKGEYYHHQLLGLRVVDDTGQFLGILSEILATGANDVYVVSPESLPDILLPATEEVVLGVDLERGEIRVHLLPGLLPE